MFIELILLFITAIILIRFLNYNKSKDGQKLKMLPGPPRLPFIGSLLHIEFWKFKGGYELFSHICSKYGTVCGFQAGLNYYVIIEDFQTAKEVALSEEFNSRNNESPLFNERSFNKPMGLILNYGESWREMRRFTIKSLKQFGFGKGKSLEGFLEEELSDFFITFEKDLKKFSNEVTMSQRFNVGVVNILWSMVAGIRFTSDDSTLEYLIKLVCEASKEYKVNSMMWAFPFLRHIPKLTEQDQVIRLHTELQNYFRSTIEDRRRKGTYREDPRDFIDIFLNEIDERKSNPERKGSNYYTDEQFIMVLLDLFIAGSDTTSNALEFAILYMILNPRVQEKVQQEIDMVVGRDRSPTVFDKPSMPYTEATVLEILRMSTVLPLGVIRSTHKDSVINSCHVPKGTLIAINSYAIHHSRDVWRDPKDFRPERFLDPENKIINVDKLLIFGFAKGNRMCLGESIARASVFTYFTTLLQKYSFHVSRKHPKPTLEMINGLSVSPVPYFTFIEKRIAN